jgi:hypothetical protein
MHDLIQVEDMRWNTTWLWFRFFKKEFSGHAAMEIKFSNGMKILLDDGYYGGNSHVFFEGDLPPRFTPDDRYPIPWRKFPRKPVP